jgi:dienelactone hydrolase
MNPTTQGAGRIEIDPQVALTDVPMTIRLTGFRPHQRVTVRAETQDDDFGRTWESFAVFETDDRGSVDLAQTAPLEGSYASADAMGLIWSMELDPAAEEECYFRKRTLDPLRIRLSVEATGEVTAQAQAKRLFLPPGVTRDEVHEQDLAGVLFLPRDPGPHPGAIVLGGGDGGILEHGAALLAARGYVGLALGYFGAESLPPKPSEIRLEYFVRAVGWLQARPEVDREAVALIGTSLGGMFGLLAAATCPDIRAVVTYVPLGIVLGVGPEGMSPACHGGQPLPFVPIALTHEEEQRLEELERAREPVSINPVFLRMLADGSVPDAAEIPVERINGPVLLLTGEDDQAIPSPVFAERIMARLEQRGFAHPHYHFCYGGAGHAIGLPHCHGLPYVPTYGRAPASGPVGAFGGTTQANARANVESWQQVLQFLAKSLPASPSA